MGLLAFRNENKFEVTKRMIYGHMQHKNLKKLAKYTSSFEKLIAKPWRH